jgi:hypothetical protein
VRSIKVITLSLFNRPKYTIQVLEHLRKCKGISEYTILPVIDNQPMSNNQDVMLQILHHFAKDGLNIDQPRFHEENVGCNANIFTCLNLGFQIADFLIHIEDDILLSKDALKYFEWAKDKYKDDQSVFTIDAYNNEQGLNGNSAYEVLKAPSFKPWGVAWFRNRWEGIKDDWKFDFGPRYRDGKCIFKQGGWDVYTKAILRGDRNRIYPRLARCFNIGALGGAHTPSEEFHWAKHKIDVWAGNIVMPDGEFYESATKTVST